ncbi:hypothetical protein [Methylobacterium fujisawaense]|uniref:hypothetical protein n=1 Tax=Methylobacterium fujisawaense TaxID=107400 RepID=UPI00313E845E
MAYLKGAIQIDNGPGSGSKKLVFAAGSTALGLGQEIYFVRCWLPADFRILTRMGEPRPAKGCRARYDARVVLRTAGGVVVLPHFPRLGDRGTAEATARSTMKGLFTLEAPSHIGIEVGG